MSPTPLFSLFFLFFSIFSVTYALYFLQRLEAAQPFGAGAQEECHPLGEATAVGRHDTYFGQERH